MTKYRIALNTAVSLTSFAIATAAAAQATAPVELAAADTAAADATLEAGDSIIVTGTRRAGRTATESAVPIDVFTASDLKVQASSDLKTILKNLVPSFNQQRNALGDGSAFVRPPTLRGLPADQVLVLLNGKRVHRSALVQVVGGSLNRGAQGADLSQLPAVALERVEVLRDGAAALYGSDAIAGVINLGLKRNDDGIELNARLGQTYVGDGEDIQLSANAGFKLGSGFVNLTAEFVDQKIWSRSVQRPDALVLEDLGFDVPQPVVRYGQPKNRAYRFVWNSAFPVGDKGEIYTFGNFGYADTINDFNYRRPIAVTTTDIPGRPGTGSFGKSIATTYLDRLPNGNWDALGRTFEASDFFPNGFTPQFASTNEDLSGVVGFKNETASGFRYDLSASYGQNRIAYNMSNTLNPSLGPDSPTDFYLGRLEQREANLNLDMSYPVDVGFASPLNIAAGLEFRREMYAVGIGETASWQIGQYASQTVQRADGTTFLSTKPIGANGFPGYGPDSVVDAARNSYSAYLDLETEIVESFTLGVAGRFDHFSDFGSTVNGKVAARWAINDIVALRGNASTGFRAPTPGQSNTANVQTTFLAGNPLPVAQATVTPNSIVGGYYGSEALRPEKSFGFSGGVVLTPGSGFNLTADYYNITVRDRLGITGNFTVSAADRTALAALGVPNAADLGIVTYFTNGFKTRTQGVDVVLSHNAATSLGSFATSLAISYNKTKVLQRKVITSPSGALIPVIDDVRLREIEGLLPRWRAVLGTNFTSGMFDIAARANFYDSFLSAGAPPGGDQRFGAEFSFDLEVGITFAERFRLAVGAENLFDNYPDRDARSIYPTSNSPANGSIYPDGSPLGYMGGFWYVRGTAKF